LQDACLQSAARLAEDLGGQKFENFRSAHFLLALERYAADIPLESRDGNILLADDSADELRELAEEFATILPNSFARRLRQMLAKHDELRGYYLETEALDEAIRDTPPLPPPPQAQLAEIVSAVEEKAADAFTHEAQQAIKQILRPPPPVELDSGDIRSAPNPETQKKRAYKVYATLARLKSIATLKNARETLVVSAAMHNTINLVKTYVWPLIDALIAGLPHWPL
jgi:hypothetical protein